MVFRFDFFPIISAWFLSPAPSQTSNDTGRLNIPIRKNDSLQAVIITKNAGGCHVTKTGDTKNMGFLPL
jgi:hypothetical protein